MTALPSQTSNSAVSSDKPVRGVPSSKAPPSNKVAQTSTVDAKIENNKVLPLEKQTTKQSLVAGNANIDTKAAGVVSHVVVTYNPQGKMRTKFLDSRNNVVYQVPPEMLAKMEDLMMKMEISTNIKG